MLFILFDNSTGCCGAHSLAEVFSTLTRCRANTVSAATGHAVHRQHTRRLSFFALDGDEYADALEASASLGIVGGGIYEAMLAHCAIKAMTETIYAWNGLHDGIVFLITSGRGHSARFSIHIGQLSCYNER